MLDFMGGNYMGNNRKFIAILCIISLENDEFVHVSSVLHSEM